MKIRVRSVFYNRIGRWLAARRSEIIADCLLNTHNVFVADFKSNSH